MSVANNQQSSSRGNAEGDDLQWVKDNGNKNFVEYALAVAELKSLEKEAARNRPQ
jgi:hypothetical protein